MHRLLLLTLLCAGCAATEVDTASRRVPSPPPAPVAVPSDDPPDGDPEPVLDLAGQVPDLGNAEPRGLVPGGVGATGDAVVAEVAGEPVHASDVARFLFRYQPDRALEALNQILDARVLEADAARLGITLPPGELEARTEAEIRDREREIRIQYGVEVELEVYLRERFGFTLPDYRRDVRELVRLQALRDRLVRLAQLREDRIRIRVMVLPDEETARAVAARLRGGADFGALARQESLAPPEELPSYPRDGIQPDALADELFALPVGGVSRPVRVARDDRQLYEIFKVIEETPGRDAGWAVLGPEVERSLAERPVRPAEYLQWAVRARRESGVRVLLDEPARHAADRGTDAGSAPRGGNEEDHR